jgi:putative transposase
MGRAPRVIAAGERYHAFARGSNKLRIFFEPVDFEIFLLQLARIVEAYGWRLYAYCLMPNHYHLLVRVSDAGLSDGMRDLNGGFSRWTSKKYGRVAHLFQNRFGLNCVADEQEFLVASRYIVLNPVRAGLCADPSEWPWSSYGATVADDQAPDWLDVPGLLEHFQVFAPGRPRDGYRRFVAEAVPAVSGTDKTVSPHLRSASTRASVSGS